MPRIPIPEYGRQRATQEPYAPYFRQSNQLAGLGDAIAGLGAAIEKKQSQENNLNYAKEEADFKLKLYSKAQQDQQAGTYNHEAFRDWSYQEGALFAEGARERYGKEYESRARETTIRTFENNARSGISASVTQSAAAARSGYRSLMETSSMLVQSNPFAVDDAFKTVEAFIDGNAMLQPHEKEASKQDSRVKLYGDSMVGRINSMVSGDEFANFSAEEKMIYLQETEQFLDGSPIPDEEKDIHRKMILDKRRQLEGVISKENLSSITQQMKDIESADVRSDSPIWAYLSDEALARKLPGQPEVVERIKKQRDQVRMDADLRIKYREMPSRDLMAVAMARTEEIATGIPKRLDEASFPNSRVPQWFPAIENISQQVGVDPALVAAIMWQESKGQADAVSPTGVKGLMQLTSATANELGVDRNSALGSIKGGATYIKMMLDQFDGNVQLATMAYNAGPGAVSKAIRAAGSMEPSKVMAALDVSDAKRKEVGQHLKGVTSIYGNAGSYSPDDLARAQRDVRVAMTELKQRKEMIQSTGGVAEYLVQNKPVAQGLWAEFGAAMQDRDENGSLNVERVTKAFQEFADYAEEQSVQLDAPVRYLPASAVEQYKQIFDLRTDDVKDMEQKFHQVSLLQQVSGNRWPEVVAQLSEEKGMNRAMLAMLHVPANRPELAVKIGQQFFVNDQKVPATQAVKSSAQSALKDIKKAFAAEYDAASYRALEDAVILLGDSLGSYDEAAEALLSGFVMPSGGGAREFLKLHPTEAHHDTPEFQSGLEIAHMLVDIDQIDVAPGAGAGVSPDMYREQLWKDLDGDPKVLGTGHGIRVAMNDSAMGAKPVRYNDGSMVDLTYDEVKELGALLIEEQSKAPRSAFTSGRDQYRKAQPVLEGTPEERAIKRFNESRLAELGLSEGAIEESIAMDFATAKESSEPVQAGKWIILPNKAKAKQWENVRSDVRKDAELAISRFGKPLELISGWRSQEQQNRIYANSKNKKHVARNSKHTAGTALDVSIAGLTESERVRLAEEFIKAGFTGIGYYGDFMHFDKRSRVPGNLSWTNLPESMRSMMESRGFAPGALNSQIRRD